MDFKPSDLCDSIRLSRQELKFPRTQMEEMVRSLAGPDWSEETSNDLSEPVNVLDLYKQVITPNLISQGPRVLLSTFDQGSKPAVAAMESWMNLEIERTEFAETMQRVGTNALFNVGICKVGLATPADAAGLSWRLQAGQPFVESIDLDDFVYDIHARRFSEASFVGHRVRRPLEAVKKSKMYSQERFALHGSNDPSFNQQGDQRLSVLGRGQRGSNAPDFEPMVDLWEVFLPRHQKIITFASNDGGDPVCDTNAKPLRLAEWIGPYCGPYHMLGYGMIPGNAMPKGPMQSLYRMHQVINHLYRKLIRQAQDQKGILTGADDGDLKRVMEASDQQVIKTSDPKSLQTLEFNGPNAMNFQFADHLMQMFSYMAGNMDSFGGLRVQSKTLGQDRMLAENASRLISDMQARTVAFAAKVLKSLAWFHWEHPFNEQTYEHKIPGWKKGLMRTVYPRGAIDRTGQPQLLRRQIPFDDLDLRVDPYSTVPQTPGGRLQAMNGVVTQIVIPMMSLLQQQGVGFDINAYLQKVGKYLDSPDLAEILTIQEPPAQGPVGTGHDGPTMPAQTERTYTRENVPMRSEKGASQQLQAALSGVKTGGASESQGVVS